jgi:TusA-related sulfurtransferase
MHIEKTLDAREWSWPWSILKTKSQLKLMKSGDVLEVIVSDPQGLEEFVTVLKQSGHELLQLNQKPNDCRLYVRCAKCK